MQPQHGGGGESERDPHHVGCGHRGPRGADRPLLQRVGLLPGLQVGQHVSGVTHKEKPSPITPSDDQSVILSLPTMNRNENIQKYLLRCV